MGIIFAERKKKGAGLRTSASTTKKPTSKYAIPSAPKGKKEAR